MKKYYINISILVVLIFSCIFSSSVFAANQPSNSYDYLYSFKSTKDDNISSFESTVKNSDEVVSGSYYYFVYYHILNNTYITFSVAKSAVSKVELVSDYKTYTDDYYFFRLRLYCSNAWSVANNRKYTLSVEDYPQNFMADGSDYSELRLYAKYDSDNRTFTFPFATNYDTNVYYPCSDNTQTIFLTNEPYIENTDEDLSLIKSDNLIINYANYDFSRFSLKFYLYKRKDTSISYENSNLTNLIELQSFTLNKDSSYLHDNKFVIPFSDFNDNQLEIDTDYLWRLEGAIYKGNSSTTTIHIDRIITSKTNKNIKATSGGSSGGGSSGGQGNITTDDKIDYSEGGVFSWIGNFLKNIWEGIKNIFDILNPFSDNFLLKNVEKYFNNIIDFLNPTSDNFFGKKIIEFLKDLLNSLFVPDQANIDNLVNTVKDKFAFIDTVNLAIESMQNMFNNINTMPSYSIEVGATQYTDKMTIKVIDLAWYAPYKKYGDLVIAGFAYVFFLWRLFITIPSIVNGVAGSVQANNNIQNFNDKNKGGN